MNNNNGGEIVQNWREPPWPGDEVLQGRFVRLEPLNADRHAADLYRANSADRDGVIWNFLPYGPFSSVSGYHHWVREVTAGKDPHFYAIVDLETGHACGVASYLRITPAAGSIEVGHINYAPELQRTPGATEAMYLMMQWAFTAGYRRYEWKCDALNLPSRQAAARLGLSYEGVFRQMSIVKGRNRDTAWFAAVDGEWPQLRNAFNAWLAPENFMKRGQQLSSLSDMTAPLLSLKDPLSHPSK